MDLFVVPTIGFDLLYAFPKLKSFCQWRCLNLYRIKGRSGERWFFSVKRHVSGTNLALKTSTK